MIFINVIPGMIVFASFESIDESGEVEPGDEHNLLWCDALGRVIVEVDLRELYMKEGVIPKLSVFPYSLTYSYRFAKMFRSAF